MNVIRQLEPIAANYNQLQPLGLDIGNGATKFVTQDREILIPSYVHLIPTSVLPSQSWA